MLKHLEMTVRDAVLTAVEAGLAALGTAVVTGGQLTKATVVAVAVVALRAGAGALANKKAAA